MNPWFPIGLLYGYVTVVLSCVTWTETGPFYRKIRKAPTQDAKLALTVWYCALWPLALLIQIPKFLFQFFKGLAFGFMSFGRGVRDLMPRRVAKIPVAKVLTRDQ